MFEAIFSEAVIVFIAGTTLFLIIMLLMIGMLIKLVFSIFRGKQRRAKQADAATIDIDRVHQVLEEIGNRANRHGEQSRPEPAYHDPSPSSVLHEASGSFGRRNNAADARADPFEIAAGRTEVPDTVQETISVILRRQVPIRDDEPPRSWLGGLPMMPENVSWPKSTSRDYPGRDPMPLHFLAQICCADLPEEVWGGLGPRVGWLLFFIDPNTCEPTGDEGCKVLHTLEPGVERQPPAEIGPVHDGVYAGPSYDYVEDVGEVPKSWRRWPVELVTVANKVNDVDGLLTVAPANFASELYRGQEVSDDRFQPVNPFTSTMAIAALSHIARRLKRQTIGPELPDSVLQGLNDPDAFISLIPDLRALKQRAEDRRREAEAIEDTQSDEAQKISHRLSKTEKYLDSQTRLSALLGRYPSGAALEDYRRDIIHANARWRAEALQTAGYA
ncbi:DUF1963 domain-containing protein [Roseibium salinum]|uniref:DUF1963 domain-containing protein n=1 Tax=Roseibium salinum TaxID=1604349 RepID=UPI0036180F83